MNNRSKLFIEIVNRVSQLLVEERLRTLILEGSRPGILYHFTRSIDRKTNKLTSPNPVIRFNETEEIQRSRSKVREDFATKYPYYISTTRKYDLDFINEEDDGRTSSFIGNIRFTLDGDKIAHRYPVVPYNFFAGSTGTRTEWGEFEERIGASRPGTVLELKKYCLEVFLRLTTARKLTVEAVKDIQKIVDYFAKFGIPVRTGRSYKPYTAKSSSTGSNLESGKLELTTVTPSILRDIQAGHISDLFYYHFPSDLDLTGLDFRKAKISGQNLSDLDLQGVNFEGVNLQHIRLQRAKLQHAVFQFAKLQHADFQFAELQHAQLQHANLQHANSYNANLQHANLQRADLRFAELRFANLEHANLQFAKLQSADLTGVKNLETCEELDTVEYDEDTTWPAGFDIHKYQKK